MTREDAISIMKVIVHMLEEKYDTDRVEDAVDMAIKALEQEPRFILKSDGTIEQIKNYDVLDKIRAEIEQEYLAEGHLSDYWDGIDKCLQIVDKYKTESENQ